MTRSGRTPWGSNRGLSHLYECMQGIMGARARDHTGGEELLPWVISRLSGVIHPESGPSISAHRPHSPELMQPHLSSCFLP